jgi:hypothetical protein
MGERPTAPGLAYVIAPRTGHNSVYRRASGAGPLRSSLGHPTSLTAEMRSWAESGKSRRRRYSYRPITMKTSPIGRAVIPPRGDGVLWRATHRLAAIATCASRTPLPARIYGPFAVGEGTGPELLVLGRRDSCGSDRGARQLQS